jgi:hypothetical protein
VSEGAAAARFGHFEVVSRIGVGGMGEVFRARMLGRDQPLDVALKLIRPDHAAQERFVKMFEAEAKISALLRHPKIVQIHDFGAIEGIPYLAMELVEGVSLEQILQSGPLPQGLAAHLACELLDALGYVHARNDEEGRPLRLVHRDVSPANLLISTTGEVKLTDFGVARLEGSQLTSTNEVKGKRAYMAPEQFEGKPLDGRTDLFSVGVVLYRMAAGVAPFRDVEDWVKTPKQAVEGSDFTDVLRHALTRKPSDRFKSAEEFARAVRPRAWPAEQARADLATRVKRASEVERPLAKLDRVILARIDGAGANDLPPDLGGTAAVKMARRSAGGAPRWPLFALVGALAVAAAAIAFAALRGRQPATIAVAPPVAPPTAPVRVAPPIAAPQQPPVVPTNPLVAAPENPPPSPQKTAVAQKGNHPPRAIRHPPGLEHPAVQPPPEEAAPDPAPGYLSLDTDPWATAYLGGRRLGTTPFVHVALPPGHHTISLDLENKGARTTLDVTVETGAEARVRKQLR